jgi:hypothetical protein
MSATAYYMYKAMTMLLEMVWDPTIEHGSPAAVKKIDPLPPINTTSGDMVGKVSMKPGMLLSVSQVCVT